MKSWSLIEEKGLLLGNEPIGHSMWVIKKPGDSMVGDRAVTVSENGNLRWKPTSCEDKHCDTVTSTTVTG